MSFIKDILRPFAPYLPERAAAPFDLLFVAEKSALRADKRWSAEAG